MTIVAILSIGEVSARGDEIVYEINRESNMSVFACVHMRVQV